MRVGSAGLALCLALGVVGCLKPGSLDHQEQFKALLQGDGGGSTDATRWAFASDAAQAPTGRALAAHDAGPAASAGCPAACNLIKARCATAGCHATSGAAAGLDLESAGLVMRLSGAAAHTTQCSGKTLLDRKAPERSLLFAKLTDPPLCGIRMPLGAALSASDLDCMRRWVASPACGSTVIEPDTDAGAPAPPADPGSLRIEAEAAGVLTSPLAAQKDSAASSGQYLSAPTASMAAKNDTPGTAGVASYIFQLGKAGSYKIWGRVRAPTIDHDSFWVRMDGGTWVQWNNIMPGADWHWDPIHDTAAMDAVMKYDLAAGQHTLNVAYRETGTDLDEFLFTTDTALVPIGANP